MTSRKTELLVGIFVALAIGATLILALQVANKGMSGGGETFQLNARFDNIGGLKARSSAFPWPVHGQYSRAFHRPSDRRGCCRGG